MPCEIRLLMSGEREATPDDSKKRDLFESRLKPKIDLLGHRDIIDQFKLSRRFYLNLLMEEDPGE